MNDINKKPIIKRRTLVIGLGGSGAQSICYLLGHLREVNALDSNGDFEPNEPIRVVSFDTDETERLLKQFSEYKDIIGNHFAQIDQLKVERKVKEINSVTNTDYRDWYPDPEKQYIKARNARHGAGQWRVLGRLAYIEEQTMIEGQIEKAFNELKSFSCEHLDSIDIDVYIVSSLCGGTGSGMLMDIAYYLQRAFIEKDSNVRVNTYGYVLLPEVFKNYETGGRVEANTYSALKEINTFYLQQADFEIEYPKTGTISIKKGNAIPFTSVFLFDKELNACKHLQSVDECCRYIAIVMYLKLVSSLAKKAKSVFANVRIPPRKDHKIAKTILENGYVYSACSGAVVEFPDETDLKDYILYRINQAIIDGSNAENERVFNVLKFLEDEISEGNPDMHKYLNYERRLGQKIFLPIQEVIEDIDKAAASENINDFSRKMQVVGEKAKAINIENIIKETTFTELKKSYDEGWEKQVTETMPKEQADIIFKKLQDEIGQLLSGTSIQLRQKLQNNIYEQILQFVELNRNLIDENNTEVKTDINRQHYHQDNFHNIIKKIKEILAAIEALSVEQKKTSSFFEPLKNELLMRFKELKIGELKKYNSGLNRFLLEKTNIHTYLGNRVKKELIENHFKDYLKQHEARSPYIIDLSERIDDFKSSLSRNLEKNNYYKKESPRGRLLNEFRIEPEELLRKKTKWIIEKSDGFWNKIDTELNELIKNLEEKISTEEDSEKRVPLPLNFNLEEKLKNYLNDTIAEAPYIEWIQVNTDYYLDTIKKALKASRISVFTNLHTHSLDVQRVFWSLPNKERSKYFFGKDEEKLKNLRREVKELVEQLFKDTSNEEFESDDNRIVIYFETHHHPAENIKGIRSYKDSYNGMGFPTSLLHIHKNYAIEFPDLLPDNMVTTTVTVHCGNPGCNYDIAALPRDIHFCPGCSQTILNRCGNINCSSNDLLNNLDGLESYAKGEVCPECSQSIKTFKWQCEKGHGYQLRTPNDQFCPECTLLAQKGKLKYEDRSFRKDDRWYHEQCLGCITKGIKEPMLIPSPEYLKGVPLAKEAFIKGQLEKFNIKNNTCKKCGSKIFPECPHHDGHVHFTVLDMDNHVACLHSEEAHSEEVAFYQCYNCDYPVKLNPNMLVHECPRCRHELKHCGHCSDEKHYLIDKSTLERTKGKCPICKYNIEEVKQ